MITMAMAMTMWKETELSAIPLTFIHLNSVILLNRHIWILQMDDNAEFICVSSLASIVIIIIICLRKKFNYSQNSIGICIIIIFLIVYIQGIDQSPKLIILCLCLCFMMKMMVDLHRADANCCATVEQLIEDD